MSTFSQVIVYLFIYIYTFRYALEIHNHDCTFYIYTFRYRGWFNWRYILLSKVWTRIVQNYKVDSMIYIKLYLKCTTLKVLMEIYKSTLKIYSFSILHGVILTFKSLWYLSNCRYMFFIFTLEMLIIIYWRLALVHTFYLTIYIQD